jgi:hypothetical protein
MESSASGFARTMDATLLLERGQRSENTYVISKRR